MCLADGMDVGELKPIEQTALLTEYARALDSRRPRSILGDSLADEVVAFLGEAIVVAVLRSITGHFDSGVVAFNDYGTVSRANRLAGKLVTTRKRMFSGGNASNSPHNQWDFPGFKDAHHPETWH